MISADPQWVREGQHVVLMRFTVAGVLYRLNEPEFPDPEGVTAPVNELTVNEFAVGTELI
jgi:hypothetical protein